MITLSRCNHTVPHTLQVLSAIVRGKQALAVLGQAAAGGSMNGAGGEERRQGRSIKSEWMGAILAAVRAAAARSTAWLDASGGVYRQKVHRPTGWAAPLSDEHPTPPPQRSGCTIAAQPPSGDQCPKGQ